MHAVHGLKFLICITTLHTNFIDYGYNVCLHLDSHQPKYQNMFITSNVVNYELDYLTPKRTECPYGGQTGLVSVT
jgi:hypothetical protein